MVLSGSYERSDSGSPVLDGQGRVMGLMVEASTQPGGTTQGIALPIARFTSILSTEFASPVTQTAIPVLADAGHEKDPSAVVTQSGCVFLGRPIGDRDRADR